MPFIWSFKITRTSKIHVYMPNFRHYDWAVICRTLMYWRDSFQGTVQEDTLSWLAIEQSAIHSSLPDLLFYAALPSKEVIKNNLILYNSIKVSICQRLLGICLQSLVI